MTPPVSVRTYILQDTTLAQPVEIMGGVVYVKIKVPSNLNLEVRVFIRRVAHVLDALAGDCFLSEKELKKQTGPKG